MEFNFVYFVILLLGLISLIHYYFTKKHSFWKNLNVPGPKPNYILGNVKENVMRKKFIGDIFTDVYYEYPKEKIVGMYVVTLPVILIRDLDLIKDIFVKDFDKFNDRGLHFDEKLFGSNIFHSDADTWTLLRKRMTPYFSTGKLKKMFYLIKECAELFMEYVNTNHPINDRLDVYQFTRRYTISVICSCAFGLNADTYSNKYNVFLDFGQRLFEPNWKFLLETLSPGSLKKFNLSPFQTDVIDFFNDLTNTLEKDREGKPRTRNDLIDMLLEMKEEKYLVGNRIKSNEAISLEMTQEVLVAQIVVFFGAGFETTASSMAFLLYELARNPHIQDKIIEEVDHIFESCNGEFTYDSISSLEYLNMAYSETLRKYPTVDPLQRQALTDYKLPGTNVTIPKGTNVFIPITGIHYDPQYWPDPEKFDPERFSPEQKNKRHSMSFLSFGEGPRSCIGARFAKIAAITGIAYFLRSYRVFRTEDTPEVVGHEVNRFIAQPDTPLNIEIRKRNGK